MVFLSEKLALLPIILRISAQLQTSSKTGTNRIRVLKNVLSILNISCSPIRILNSDTWLNEKDKFDNIIIWAKIERGLNHHFNCIRLDFFIFCTCSNPENDCLLPPFRSYPLLRPNNGCTKKFISRPIIHRSAHKKKTIIIPR